MKKLTKCCITCLLLFTSTVDSLAQQKDSSDVRAAVARFVKAFNALDWEPFRNSFAEDATIFFPDWEWALRRSGKKDIEKTWITIFPEFTDPNDTLTLNINPKDVLIQLYGKTAIITFHLGSGEKYLARRTLVMVKKKKDWKIAHLHASVLMAPKK
jgi:ketosteroid isomerase-like protein